MDVIEQLGALALASRLKRLADRLGRDVSRIYDENEIDFHARWFPLMFLLSANPRCAITQIAEELGMTHPSVNQIAGQMNRHGLLRVSGDVTDGRKRLLSLSDKGHTIYRKLQSLWDVIRRANDELVEEAGGELLKQLTSIEKALERREMYDRVRDLIEPGSLKKKSSKTRSHRRKG